jgi:hypothetical protein
MRTGTAVTSMFVISTSIIWLSACASKASNTRPDGMLTGSVFSVSCERGWSDCYSEAQRRCPSGRFDEIDRGAIEQTFNDRNDAQMANLKGEPMNRSIVVRCK